MRTVPRLCELYPGICFTTEKKARKNLSQGKKNLSQGKKNLSQVKENLSQFISHNTTSFYSLFIQADNMFRPMF